MSATYQVTYVETENTTELAHDSIQGLPSADELETVRANCCELGVSAKLTDESGSSRGTVYPDGSFNLR